MSVNLPVELWQTILLEAIALPKFFDIDHLPEVTNPLYKYEKYLNRDRSEYWAMERHRNALCRVCKSWNTYLRQSEHRYVEMHDVLHDHVPKEALRKAIRIGYRPCKSTCSLCYNPHERFSVTEMTVEKLPARIVDDRGNGSGYMAIYLGSMHVEMPQLQVVLSHDRSSSVSGVWKVSGHAKLKVAQLGTSEQWVPEVERNVVTLSLPTYTQLFFGDPARCSFPALHHLRFVHLPNILENIVEIFHLIKNIGSNLRSLQLGTAFLDREMPKELWGLCPNLERLDSTFSIKHSPPDDHPLNTMSFFIPFIMADGRPQLPFYPDLESFRSMRRLISQSRWEEIEQRWSQFDILGDWLRGLMGACIVQGVTLEDSAGVLLQDSRVEGLLKSS